MKKSLIGRPFKSITKFTLIERNAGLKGQQMSDDEIGIYKDYFKVTFLDDSTATYNSDNVVVLKSKIIKE